MLIPKCVGSIWICPQLLPLVILIDPLYWLGDFRDLTPEEAWNKCDLFEKLSIENWILPGCFVGVFSTIVWVCPPWSDQIEPGEHEFYVGVERGTERLAVSCLQSYYISEGLFVPQKNLDNAKKIKLVVVKMESESNCDTRDQMVRVHEQIAEVWLKQKKGFNVDAGWSLHLGCWPWLLLHPQPFHQPVLRGWALWKVEGSLHLQTGAS